MKVILIIFSIVVINFGGGWLAGMIGKAVSEYLGTPIILGVLLSLILAYGAIVAAEIFRYEYCDVNIWATKWAVTDWQEKFPDKH